MVCPTLLRSPARSITQYADLARAERGIGFELEHGRICVVFFFLYVVWPVDAAGGAGAAYSGVAGGFYEDATDSHRDGDTHSHRGFDRSMGCAAHVFAADVHCGDGCDRTELFGKPGWAVGRSCFGGSVGSHFRERRAGGFQLDGSGAAGRLSWNFRGGQRWFGDYHAGHAGAAGRVGVAADVSGLRDGDGISGFGLLLADARRAAKGRGAFLQGIARAARGWARVALWRVLYGDVRLVCCRGADFERCLYRFLSAQPEGRGRAGDYVYVHGQSGSDSGWTLVGPLWSAQSDALLAGGNCAGAGSGDGGSARGGDGSAVLSLWNFDGCGDGRHHAICCRLLPSFGGGARRFGRRGFAVGR